MLTLMPRCSAIASDVIPDMIAAQTWASGGRHVRFNEAEPIFECLWGKALPHRHAGRGMFHQQTHQQVGRTHDVVDIRLGEPAGLAAAIEIDPIGLLAVALHQGETIGDP